MDASKINIKNKRAEYDYQILEKFTAGIVLTGTEIKSIRDGSGSLNEAYCQVKEDGIWLRNMNIPEYSHGTYANHDPLRHRKLLLRKKELSKIESKTKERGLTMIPLRMYMSDRGFAKVDIALAKGKKTFDKRESIKQKDDKRELDRVMKKYR